MAHETSNDRLAEKTPEASFLHVLQDEFNLSLRAAREVVSAAQEYLGLDQPSAQVRLVVASLRAPVGPPLTETDRVTVTLTVDAGPADAVVLAQEGRVGLRRGASCAWWTRRWSRAEGSPRRTWRGSCRSRRAP